MDTSALESVSRSFESSLDCWGRFILVSTAIVAIGLVVEYWEPAREFIEECRRPATVFPWYKFMGLAGGILITVGVFGEFWGAYKASRVETGLRDNNHKIEISLNDRASQAKLKQIEIEQDNIKLRIELEKLRRANGPRYLSPQEKNRLAAVLSPFHLTSWHILSMQGDKGAELFAKDLEDVFKNKLHVLGGSGWLPAPPDVINEAIPPPGITIEVSNPDKPPPVAKALKSFFDDLNFTSRIAQPLLKTWVAGDNNSLQLAIGSK